MTQDCTYPELVRDIDYYATQVWQPRVGLCPQPAAFYVSLVVDVGDFSAELLNNLCAGHDEQVRRDYRDAWRWSRSTTEADAQGWHRKFGGPS